MPRRNFNSDDYRYGFNGKENDQEIKGSGNSVDFGARIYDPRLGRFLSVDPIANKFSGWSPYAFAFDNPINVIDPDGMAGDDPRNKFYSQMGTSAIEAVTSRGVENKYKALYLVAQRRVENSFNLNPPGNNPMNIKGTGDAGVVSEKTTEYINGKKISITDNFASFSSVEKGFAGYLNLLQVNFPDAYSALTDNSKSITDFTSGLQNGKLGGFATSPTYEADIQSIFKGVVNDYKKTITAEIDENQNKIAKLTQAQSSLVISEKYRNALPGEIKSINNKNESLKSELKQLNEIK